MSSKRTEKLEWPPFDLDRLTEDERELWEESYSTPGPGPPIWRVWSFAEVCEFDYAGVPEVVHEYLVEDGFLDAMATYITNMRKATGRPRM